MRRLKGQGAGFLGDVEKLKKVSGYDLSGTRMRISIKTRIGVEDPEEFGPLLKYLTCIRFPNLSFIHVQRKNSIPERYIGKYIDLPGRRVVCRFVIMGICLLWKNMRRDYAFPKSRAVMFGRGVLGDPLLLSRIRRTKGKTATWGRSSV